MKFGPHQSNKRRSEFLQRSFEALSPDEQDQANRDIYGKETPTVESPELIAAKVNALYSEVNLLSKKVRKAYTQALDIIERKEGALGYYYNNQSREYFYLMFLRADQFHARMAARRLTRFFTIKMELFGINKLGRRIEQFDLSPQDKEVLSSGALCITGATDDVGRLIIFIRRNELIGFNVTSIMRVWFYFVEAVIPEHEESQKRGVVILAHSMGPPRRMSPFEIRKRFPALRLVMQALPIRPTALHWCYNDPRHNVFFNFFLVVIPKSIRSKIHYHNGCHEECMARLRSYGIIDGDLPLTAEGDIQEEMILNSLQRNFQFEEMENLVQSVKDCSLNNDQRRDLR